MILSPEEMKEAGRDYHRDGRWTERRGSSRDIAIAKAQAKALFDWLDEHNCQSTTHNAVFGLLLDNDDWQQLKQEVEE